MKKSELIQIIREEVRNVLRSRLNEAFKSSILRDIIKTIESSTRFGLAKDFANSFVKQSKIPLDQVTDDDIQEMSPDAAYKMIRKSGDPRLYVVFMNKAGGTNPYAKEKWNTKIPPNSIIAIANGQNMFLDMAYSRFSREPGLRASKDYSGIGIEKSGGRYGTGIVNVKRASEVSDVAYVIDSSKIHASGKDTSALQSSRTTQKTGAVAFMTPEQFRKDNLTRYKEILRNQAAATPVDKMVMEFINLATAAITKAVSTATVNRYNQITVGTLKGRDVTASDLSYTMRNVLDNFERYTSYMKQAAEAGESPTGGRNSYYTNEAKAYALRIKEELNSIKTLK